MLRYLARVVRLLQRESYVQNTDTTDQVALTMSYSLLFRRTSSLRTLNLVDTVQFTPSSSCAGSLLEQLESPVLESVHFTIFVLSIPAVDHLPWKEIIERLEKHDTLRDIQWKFIYLDRKLAGQVLLLPRRVREQFALFGPRSARILQISTIAPIGGQYVVLHPVSVCTIFDPANASST
jgi:hypothetical protein